MTAIECSQRSAAGIESGQAHDVVASGTGGVIVRALEALLGWQARARQRYMLLELDDRMLADIGLSRADVAAEAGKRPWQP